MSLQKLQDYILESWLPTKLTILIAGSTISLALLSIGLPNFLQTISIQLTEEKTLLLRLVAPLSILCLGTFIVLLLVLHHYKNMKTSQNQQPTLQPLKSNEKSEDKIILSEMHEKVLELLFKQASTVETVSKALKLTREEANYYLNDLWSMDMVDPPVAYSSSSNWRIDQDGREYVMKKRAIA